MRPGRRDSTTARWARKAASTIEWVTNSTVIRRSRQSSWSCSSSCWRVISSSAANGSSSSSRSGLGHQRARERGAHAHAARELRRIAAGGVGETDLLDRLARAVEPFRARDTAELERQRDVVEQVAPRQQVGVLEDVGDRRVLGRFRRWRDGRSRTMVPRVGRSRPAISRSSVDLPHPDGPSRARNWPGWNAEVDAIDGDDAAVELAADVVQLDADP